MEAAGAGAGGGGGGGVVAGVRKAAAVTGYRLEGGQYQPEGKLGLAILGKEGAASYQLLLYRCRLPAMVQGEAEWGGGGGPRACTGPGGPAGLLPHLQVHSLLPTLLRDTQGVTWSVAFGSEEAKESFVHEVLLCRRVAEQGLLAMVMARGEGMELQVEVQGCLSILQVGDQVEVVVTVWRVEGSAMVQESTTKGGRGMRWDNN